MRITTVLSPLPTVELKSRNIGQVAGYKHLSVVSGGGTSGRVLAFCLSRPGSYSATDLGFLHVRTAVNLLSLGIGLFLITCNRTVHTLPSCFLFTVIIYNRKMFQCTKKKAKINLQRGRERPILEKKTSVDVCLTRLERFSPLWRWGWRGRARWPRRRRPRRRLSRPRRCRRSWWRLTWDRKQQDSNVW